MALREASPAFASKLVACTVLASDHWFSLFDHAPIVAGFDLSLPPGNGASS